MKENADKARGLDTAEINKQLREGAEQAFRLRFQLSMGLMDGLKKVRLLRKERARMLTVLRERELDPAGAAKAQASAKASAKSKPAKSKAKPEKSKPVKAKPARTQAPAKAKAPAEAKAPKAKAAVKKAPAAKKAPAKTTGKSKG